jgi:hypothetical protein
MNQTVPTQHPAVVLRSHYRHLRSLLVIAMVAVVGLAAATVILALDDGNSSGTTSAADISNSLRGSSSFEARPDESGVAASIAESPAVAKPDESKIAASIALRHLAPPPPTSTARPDESNVASAISGTNQSNESTRPDESNVASTISGGTQSDQGTRPDESSVASAISGN